MSGASMQTWERPLLVSHVLSMEGDWVWVTRLPAGTAWQYPGTPSLARLLSQHLDLSLFCLLPGLFFPEPDRAMVNKAACAAFKSCSGAKPHLRGEALF